MLYPFIMRAYYKNYIWGGRNLEKLGKCLPDGNVAETWEVSAHPDGESSIMGGCWAGRSLKETIEACPKAILGEAVIRDHGHIFPLLFKLVDANDQLSVQVHPGDAYAQRFGNEPNGKYEAWYILEAAPDAKIVYGLLPGTNSEQLKRLIKENCIGDGLNTVRVRPGDVISIAPGTIHAIGKGIVLAEIQQNSNLTYRVYDYDRKDALGNTRKLHIEKALDVIDYSPPEPFAKGTISFESQNATITNMLRNKYFQLDLIDIRSVLEMDAKGDRFYILYVVKGEVCIAYDHGALSAKMGESILIPASLGRYTITGECRLLKMYVPAD